MNATCDEGLVCRIGRGECVEPCDAGEECDSSGQGPGFCAESGLPFCAAGPLGLAAECSCSPTELGDYSCL